MCQMQAVVRHSRHNMSHICALQAYLYTSKLYFLSVLSHWHLRLQLPSTEALKHYFALRFGTRCADQDLHGSTAGTWESLHVQSVSLKRATVAGHCLDYNCTSTIGLKAVPRTISRAKTLTLLEPQNEMRKLFHYKPWFIFKILIIHWNKRSPSSFSLGIIEIYSFEQNLFVSSFMSFRSFWTIKRSAHFLYSTNS